MKQAVVNAVDAGLRRILGVYEFTHNPDCILRTSLSHAPHDFNFPGCLIKKGEPVIAIHLWNERIPRIPAAGPDLAWAARLQRLFVSSLRMLAVEIQSKPALKAARALYAATVLFTMERPGRIHPMERFGFTVAPYHSSMGRIGEAVANTYSWMLMSANNPPSTRGKNPRRLRRTEIWMETDHFLERYGSAHRVEI